MVFYTGYHRPKKQKVEFTVQEVECLHTKRGDKWVIKGEYEGDKISTFAKASVAQDIQRQLQGDFVEVFGAEIAYEAPDDVKIERDIKAERKKINKDDKGVVKEVKDIATEVAVDEVFGSETFMAELERKTLRNKNLTSFFDFYSSLHNIGQRRKKIIFKISEIRERGYVNWEKLEEEPYYGLDGVFYRNGMVVFETSPKPNEFEESVDDCLRQLNSIFTTYTLGDIDEYKIKIKGNDYYFYENDIDENSDGSLTVLVTDKRGLEIQEFQFLSQIFEPDEHQQVISDLKDFIEYKMVFKIDEELYYPKKFKAGSDDEGDNNLEIYLEKSPPQAVGKLIKLFQDFDWESIAHYDDEDGVHYWDPWHTVNIEGEDMESLNYAGVNIDDKIIEITYKVTEDDDDDDDEDDYYDDEDAFDYFDIDEDDLIPYDGRYNGKTKAELLEIEEDRDKDADVAWPKPTLLFCVLYSDVEDGDNLWDLEAYLNQFTVSDLTNKFIRKLPYESVGNLKSEKIEGIILGLQGGGEDENLDGDALIEWVQDNDMEDEEITVYPDDGDSGEIYLDDDEDLALNNAEEQLEAEDGLDPKYIKADGTPDMRYKYVRDWLGKGNTMEAETEIKESLVESDIELQLPIEQGMMIALDGGVEEGAWYNAEPDPIMFREHIPPEIWNRMSDSKKRKYLDTRDETILEAPCCGVNKSQMRRNWEANAECNSCVWSGDDFHPRWWAESAPLTVMEAESIDMESVYGNTVTIPNKVFYRIMMDLPNSIEAEQTEDGLSYILSYHDQYASLIDAIVDTEKGVVNDTPTEISFEDENPAFNAEYQSEYWAEDLSGYSVPRLERRAEFKSDIEVMTLEDYYENVMDFKDSDVVKSDFAGNVIVSNPYEMDIYKEAESYMNYNEGFDVEFDDWAKQEMKTHGESVSFKDWAEEEGESHGDVPLMDWAEHEEESHDARYGAESFGAEMTCPPATKDVAINTKNRNATIKNFSYGPLNVDEPGDFWEKIAKQWDTSVEAAKKSKCGNCVAFDRSPRMKDCMPGETSDGEGVLGYCWMHHFKCHSARTCDTWAKGGPITTDKVSEGWQERAFAKPKASKTATEAGKATAKAAESFEAQDCGWCGDKIVGGGTREGEKVCSPCVVAYDKENNRGSPCVVCGEKTEMGAYSYGKGEWVSICSKDCELDYDDYEAESFEADATSCFECGRMGYTDEMSRIEFGYLCARCANPHIDFDKYSIKRSEGITKSTSGKTVIGLLSAGFIVAYLAPKQVRSIFKRFKK